METKVCTKCGKELPKTREYFTASKYHKDGFHNHCKKCRGFKSYGFALNTENKELAKNGLKKCKYCGKVKPIEEYRMVGKHRRIEYCPDCEAIAKKEKAKYDKKYLEENKEKKKEYYQQWKEQGGSEIRRINEQQREARKRSLKNTLTLEDWHDCLEYFDNRCAYCGCKSEQLSQDHVIPLSKGGEYVRENIVPACKSCNSSKNNRDLDYFYELTEYFTYERYIKILEWINFKNN